MGINLLFWKKSEDLFSQTQEIIQTTIKGCQCGSGLAFNDCHAIEFALPDHERPDPD